MIKPLSLIQCYCKKCIYDDHRMLKYETSGL